MPTTTGSRWAPERARTMRTLTTHRTLAPGLPRMSSGRTATQTLRPDHARAHGDAKGDRDSSLGRQRDRRDSVEIEHHGPVALTTLPDQVPGVQVRQQQLRPHDRLGDRRGDVAWWVMKLDVAAAQEAVGKGREHLLLLARARRRHCFEGALHQRLQVSWKHRRQLSHQRAKALRRDRTILGRLPEDHYQQLGLAQVEAALATARGALGHEPIALAPNQWQPHVGADDVEISLDLPFAQMELVSKLATALP